MACCKHARARVVRFGRGVRERRDEVDAYLWARKNRNLPLTRPRKDSHWPALRRRAARAII